MAQKPKAFDILVELGEARRNRDDWPDYKQYGIGRDDIDDLLNLVTAHAHARGESRLAQALEDDGFAT